jgi:hypothetical protein
LLELIVYIIISWQDIYIYIYIALHHLSRDHTRLYRDLAWNATIQAITGVIAL